MARPSRFEVKYSGAHKRSRQVLRDQPCAMQDTSCKGRLEIALRHETPLEYVRVDPDTGFRYSPRPEDYFRLCISHHIRYDKPSKEVQQAAQRARRERERIAKNV